MSATRPRGRQSSAPVESRQVACGSHVRSAGSHVWLDLVKGLERKRWDGRPNNTREVPTSSPVTLGFWPGCCQQVMCSSWPPADALQRVGDEFELLSTDKGSINDIPEWIKKVGHEMLSSEQVEGVWHIKVRKAK